MQGNTINLAERFAYSSHFKVLFADGMALVEESASYLDGQGRVEVKELERKAASLYATESMRLTTRLMQLASWLLLQRAANEGEMTREQLLDEKQKVKLEREHGKSGDPAWQNLPHAFRDLVDRSIALQKRVVSLDEELYGDKAEGEADQGSNPVDQQINLLSTALGAKKAV